jgi:hypothetical protein
LLSPQWREKFHPRQVTITLLGMSLPEAESIIKVVFIRPLSFVLDDLQQFDV